VRDASAATSSPNPAPDKLAPLLEPQASLRGVGPALATLLFHLPESFVDRRHRPSIKAATPGQVATLAVDVVRHEQPATPRQPWRVVVTDGTGFAELVFFKPARAQALTAGSQILVSGKLEKFADRLTMPHPDFLVTADQPERIPALEPVWPLTAGLFPAHPRDAGMARTQFAETRALAWLRASPDVPARAKRAPGPGMPRPPGL
jgi:ATP-dependent DNA helicase RecG